MYLLVIVIPPTNQINILSFLRINSDSRQTLEPISLMRPCSGRDLSEGFVGADAVVFRNFNRIHAA